MNYGFQCHIGLGICPEEGLNLDGYLFVFLYFAALVFVHLFWYLCWGAVERAARLPFGLCLSVKEVG